MTAGAILRKMNPPREADCFRPCHRWWGGNAWQNGASEEEDVRLADVTEERKNEEAKVGGGFGVGHGVGGDASAGAGCGKERAAETGAEPFSGGAGTVERNR